MDGKSPHPSQIYIQRAAEILIEGKETTCKDITDFAKANHAIGFQASEETAQVISRLWDRYAEIHSGV